MRWRRRRVQEEDLARELHDHLELEADEQQRETGLSAEEARLAARRTFGNVTYTQEEVRSMWGWTRWEAMLQDVRFAWRGLRKSPGFAVTAVLTLALGIGASTAVFTVVDSVLLKPLDYPDSGNLVAIWEHLRFLGGDAVGPNPRHVDFWKKRAPSTLREFTVLRNTLTGVTAGDTAPRLTGMVLCMANVFDVLRVRPVLGRSFVAEEGVSGKTDVVVLTHALWQSLFNSDPGVIGKTVRLNDVPHEVVGVLPDGFHFPNANALTAFDTGQAKAGVPEPGLFRPIAMNFDEMEWNGNYGNFVTLARLAPGVGAEATATQLSAVQEQLWKEMPGGNRGDAPGAVRVTAQPLREAIVGDSQRLLWLLLGAVGGLMLIACLNLANAQLGRALTHRRDAAVRAALGAARWRLLWSALAENLLLAGIGAAIGTALAAIGIDLLRRYPPVDLPRLAEVRMDITVLLFTMGLTVAASLLSGMAPALRLLSADPQVALQQGSVRAFGSRHSVRLRTWLIGVQVFGCTVLLLVTGLFGKSLLHLLRQDRGFETAHLAVAEVRLPPVNSKTAEERAAFIDGVLQNLRSSAGVEAAGFVSAMPLEGESWIESLRRLDRPELEGPMVNARWVSPGYFEATGQRLVAGRFIEERDRDLPSVVISEGEAKALWGDADPIGGLVQVLGRKSTVVGVVGDSRSTSLKAAPVRMAYVHFNYRTPGSIYFVARSRLGTQALVARMREAIGRYSPTATVARVKSMEEQLADSVSRERFQTLILMAFGVAALLLAMLGIYGVLSYSIAARTQEIGLRMALGATRASVYVLAMAEAAAPVVLGLAAGVAAGLLSGDVVEKLLFGTRVVDAGVIATVVTLFLGAAAIAAFLPARRAASVNPLDALRPE